MQITWILIIINETYSPAPYQEKLFKRIPIQPAVLLLNRFQFKQQPANKFEISIKQDNTIEAF